MDEKTREALNKFFAQAFQPGKLTTIIIVDEDEPNESKESKGCK